MKKTIYTIFVFSAVMTGSVLAQSDNPCDAPSLNPDVTCNFTNGALPVSTTNTPSIPAPGCAGYNGKDIWYKVVVPTNGILTIDLGKLPGTLTDMGMAWYAGVTCAGPFTLIECDDDDSNNGLMPKITRTGMTPGSTIWVRLWEDGGNVTGNFQICASSPVCVGGANNTCATAKPFCTGTPLHYCNTTGVESMDEEYSCLEETPNPMWLYLQISTPGDLDILIRQTDEDGVVIDVDFALYGPFPNLASACNSIQPNSATIDCSFSDSGNETANIDNAQVGQIYMMLVTNYEDEPGIIKFTQTGGGGATNCNTVMPCTVTATMVSDTCNSGAGKVTAVPGTGTAPYTYSWTTLSNQTTPTVNGVTAGVHSVTMTTSDGCIATATVTVTNNAPTSTGSMTPASCPGINNGTATANMVPVIGTVTYLWNDANAQTTQTATGLPAGTYSCRMTSSSGCVITQLVTVTAVPEMVATIANQQNATCNGRNDGIVNVAVTQGTAPYTYLWSNSTSTTNIANDLSAGIHTVTVKDAAGCTVIQSVTLTEPLPLKMDFITPDSSICPGSSLAVTANGSGGKQPYTYIWSSGSSVIASDQTMNVTPVTAVTQYCVAITDGCGSSVDSCMTVSFPNPIVLSIVPDRTVGCQPATFTFSNNSGPADQVASTLFTFGNGEDTLVLGTGSASTVYTNAQSYTVGVQVTSVFGCVYAGTFPDIVEAVAIPVAAFTISPNPTTIFETNVKMHNNSVGTNLAWNWSAPDAVSSSSTNENPVFTFPEGIVGQYPIQLIVTTPEGCTDTITNILVVNSDIVFYAPNAFTPNGDGHNQSWRIYAQGIDVNNFQVSIFNRWGEMIWESHNPEEPWDGTYAGNIVSDGTYTWKASVKDIYTELKKEYRGSITVVK